jgi:carbon storage regulator
MLVLNRRIEESVVITVGGHKVTVTLLTCADGKARLGFEAPKEVLILRKELESKEESHGS